MNDHSPPAVSAVAPTSIGTRLRDGREAMGWSAAEAAAKLRVPQAIVEAIERDDFERLGAAVYARGYLASYARLLDLPLVLVDSALTRVDARPPALHSATHVSHGRYLFERYARRAVYIVLTASIVIPVVWLATEERLPVHPLSLRSLDAPPPAQTSNMEDGSAQSDGFDSVADAVGPPEALRGGTSSQSGDKVAVMASFAPFLGNRGAARDESVGDVGWRLVFRGDSWVEIVDRDGRRLEFGLIRAGSELRYDAGALARVALGNASVVEVSRDGQPMSLAPFQRANVARFAVSSGGELQPSGG